MYQIILIKFFKITLIKVYLKSTRSAVVMNIKKSIYNH